MYNLLLKAVGYFIYGENQCKHLTIKLIMADIEQNNYRKQRGITQGKKFSTRVDLTPMVDLGFLLITFFIFTTSIAQPVAMNLAMPDDRPDKNPTRSSEDKTLTLVIGGSDRIFYYEGIFGSVLNETTYQPDGLRAIIMKNKQRIKSHFNTNDLVVLIKATNEASYKNIIACLDEMLISDVSIYMLLDPSDDETRTVIGK